MHIVSVTDPDDPILDDYRDLTDVALRESREAAGGLYIAESMKVIQRAVAAGHRPRSVLVQQQWVERIASMLDGVDVPVYVVTDAVAEAVSGYAIHRGAIASMHRPSPSSVDELLSTALSAGSRRPRIAILEAIGNHTNVGACFRSAAALGIDAVIVSPTCADPLYRRSVRVSMGTVFQVPWTRATEWPGALHAVKDAGFTVAGMTLAEGSITLDDLVAEDHGAVAIAFGHEGSGLLSTTDELLDRRVMIPMMHGVDSLNVAAASAVAFYATR